jgi:hypothetical protein
MQTGLAEAWRSRVAGQAAERDERLEAESNLALSLLHQGKDVEAGPMFRRLHEVMMRVLGAEHPGTLTTAGNLATSLSHKAFFLFAEGTLDGPSAGSERIAARVRESRT